MQILFFHNLLIYVKNLKNLKQDVQNAIKDIKASIKAIKNIKKVVKKLPVYLLLKKFIESNFNPMAVLKSLPGIITGIPKVVTDILSIFKDISALKMPPSNIKGDATKFLLGTLNSCKKEITQKVKNLIKFVKDPSKDPPGYKEYYASLKKKDC